MVLIFLLIFAVVVSAIAHSRGRNAVGWFFIGFFAGILGIIILLVIPNLTEQRIKDEERDERHRRLKEKVKKDKIIAEQKHREVSARLGIHDEVLGIDSGQMNQRLAGRPPTQEAATGLIVHLKRCPKCAENVKSEARVCRFCQYEFTPTEPVNDHGDPLKKCPDCAEMIRLEAKVCRYCKYTYPASAEQA